MSDFKEQSAYFLIRASQETEHADCARDPRAEAAHRELAMRYSIQAFQLRLAEMDLTVPEL